MDVLRNPRFAPPLLLLALIVGTSAAVGSWLPMVATPWLVAIAWFGSKDAGAAREFPSAAEASRERLWAR